MTTIVVGLRVLLAVVFGTAGVAKLLDLKGSRRAVAEFGVPQRAADTVGLLLPLAELAVAIGLLFRPTARWAALVGLLLLVAFMIGIGRALARGQQPDCHCFGQLHSSPAGRGTLIRNGILAVCAAVVVVYGSGTALDTWVSGHSAAVLVAIALGIVAVAAVGYAASLRIDLQRTRRDRDMARKASALGRVGLPIGLDAPPFALADLDGSTVSLASLTGRGQPLLLMFMTPWCGPCSALGPKVAQWQQTLSERLTIAVISSGTAEQNEPFEETGLENVLLQESWEVAEDYRINGTPTAVFITPEGKIASNPGEMEQGIEPLVRLALRDGVRVPAEA